MRIVRGSGLLSGVLLLTLFVVAGGVMGRAIGAFGFGTGRVWVGDEGSGCDGR